MNELENADKYKGAVSIILNNFKPSQIEKLEKDLDSQFTPQSEKMVIKELLKSWSEFETERSDRNEIGM